MFSVYVSPQHFTSRIPVFACWDTCSRDYIQGITIRRVTVHEVTVHGSSVQGIPVRSNGGIKLSSAVGPS